jgi:hypothetical protein
LSEFVYKEHQGMPPTCGCTWAEHRRLKRIDWLMSTIMARTYGKPDEREAYYRKFCAEVPLGDNRSPGAIRQATDKILKELKAEARPRPLIGFTFGNWWLGLWRGR